MVRGWSAAGVAASAVKLAQAPSKNARTALDTIRIIISPSVRQTELDSNMSRKIHRLAFAQGRLEFNCLCCFHRGFVKTMPQTADDVVDVDAAIGKENEIQDHVSLDLEGAAFGGVLRAWFVQNGW